MSKSTRLLTATYIMSYVAANAPEVVTTERIAEQVNEHPTRVRQIVAALVKAGLLAASRGAAGGVSLNRRPAEVTLREIQEAVEDGSLLALHLYEPRSEWAGKSRVHLVFENLRDELEKRIRDYLDEHTLDQTYAPIIVPFSPGGTTDILARTLSEHLAGGLGAPVLVEHRPGRARRAGALAAHATQAELGGRTLTIMTNSGVLSTALLRGARARESLVPVTLLAESEMILAVSARSAWTSVAALARSAKAARKRPLRYASVGIGSVSHLCGALFGKVTGATLEHRAYDGAQPAVHALIAGEVDVYFGTPPTFLPHVRAGSVRPLATTAAQRPEVFPELPRMSDTYAGFEVVGWHGVFAPADASAAEVARLHERVAAVMGSPEVRRRLARQGFRVATSTPAELAERIAREVAQWRARMIETGLELEDAAAPAGPRPAAPPARRVVTE